MPKLDSVQEDLLTNHAWKIVAIREQHPGKTMAWLYSPDTMPEDLLAAHQALDDAFEKIYIGRSFKDDTERLEYLFQLYSEMTTRGTEVTANA
jgi:hypothetical protein